MKRTTKKTPPENGLKKDQEGQGYRRLLEILHREVLVECSAKFD